MATVPQTGESFSIGRVFSRMFSQITGNLMTVGVFVLVIHLVSMAISYFSSQQLTASVAANLSSGAPAGPLAMFQSPAYWVMLLVGMVLGLISMGGAIYGYFQSETEGSTSIEACAKAGLSKAFPLLVVYILWFLGIYIGMIFLLVPGLMLLTMWSVALPALVGENAGIIGSFGRSRALTKGSRWIVFGVLVIFAIILYIILGTFMFTIMRPMMAGMTNGAPPNPLAAMGAMTSAMLPVSFILGLVMALVLPSLLVSIYRELRLVKVGNGPDTLRDIFA